MEPKIAKEVFSHFTYEIIERIIRFLIHLDEIESQFYSERSKIGSKNELIDNYRNTLYNLLSGVVIGYKNGIKSDGQYLKSFKLLKKILCSANKLHTKYLSVLPRPSEPVELNRFVRVIDKQVVKLADKSNKIGVSISFNEEIGEGVEGDYLHDFKEEIKEVYNHYAIPYDFNDHEEKVYIKIPRIDASNTFRWPSLIHEICHSLFINVIFDRGGIEKDFLSYIGDENNDIIGYFKNNGYKLEKWLEECWCDLFACILIGPSFYFSQFLTFLNNGNNVDSEHPPNMFRLYLIESIIQHRFSCLHKDVLGHGYIAEYEEVLGTLILSQDDSPEEESLLNKINNNFNLYFLSHFFTNEKEGKIAQLKDNPEINKKLRPLVNKYVRLDPKVIVFLRDRLNNKLPIPSIRIKNSKGKYKELPTYVQEIFIASWLSRHDILIPKILEELCKLNTENTTDKKEVYKNIFEAIIRHDRAILKSIQVSEWFDFLNGEKQRPKNITVFRNDTSSFNLKKNASGILVDSEIENLILQDELKIIPIMMNVNEPIKNKIFCQIGTASLDIRLGSTFQIFYPDQHGIIDFTEWDEQHSFLPTSKRLTLDFVEGLTIIPGQFLLGHSMEYIKLPDYISGNLEGRSSFARLGIEIHMTAGYIDPGFEGTLTFEIYNAGNTAVRLYPSMRIGQIRFEKGKIPRELYSKKHTVKYKGLLEHNMSKQNSDFEVELIKRHRGKNKL
jgi:dCTP deaminase